MHTQDEFSYFSITIRNFKNLKYISRKSHCIPHITKKYGLPFILHNHKHKLIFFISIIICFCLICYLSTFVWNIEFEGNAKYSDDTLLKALKEFHIFTGQRKKRIDIDNLEEELRLKYDDIVWVSATIDGTVLKVYLKEAITTDIADAKTLPGNIISNTDCIVESIVTRNGTPKVIQGETVQAGEILIEGIVSIYNDDQTIKEEHAVIADGDIHGRYKIAYNDYYPKWTMDKSQINHTTYGLSVNLLNFKLKFGDQTHVKENCIQTVNQIHYRLTPNFYLPFQVLFYTNHYYNPQKVFYSGEQVQAIGNERISQQIKKLKTSGAIIHKNNLQIIIEKEYYIISGELEVTAPIGEFIPCQ